MPHVGCQTVKNGWSSVAILLLFCAHCSKRFPLLPRRVERMALRISACVAFPDEDVGPRLFAAFALVFDDRGASLSLDEKGIAVLAHGLFDCRT